VSGSGRDIDAAKPVKEGLTPEQVSLTLYERVGGLSRKASIIGLISEWEAYQRRPHARTSVFDAA